MERYFEINGRGHNIRCKLYCAELKNIRRMVVFCHGFGGHKDNTAAAKFADRMLTKVKGMALVTFNLPCHGDDVKKKLSLEECGEYLDLVVAFLREKYANAELYAYATSFGGYLLLKYLAQRGNPFRKIALRCPAVNMHRVLTERIMESDELERLQRGKEIRVGFDRKIPVTAKFLQELQENDILKEDYLEYAEDMRIFHGTADEVVPFAEVENFAQENLIEFIPVEGADHRFRHPGTMDRTVSRILEFFLEP